MTNRHPRSRPIAAQATTQSNGIGISAGNTKLRASWLLFALAVVVVGFRPIAASDFWWDLSRGREVIRGSFTPSRVLLTLDMAPEADWLGGVPSFLVYSSSGSSGLMLLRISAAMALAWSICRVTRGSHPAIVSVLVFIGLIGAERAFDLGPRMFDAFGIVAAFRMAKRLLGAATSRGLFPLAIVFVACYHRLLTSCSYSPEAPCQLSV